MHKYSAFSYKSGNSLFHKMPAWLKILLIPALNIVVFNLHPLVSVFFVILQFIIACCLRFSIREQLSDLKPVIFYAALLYLIGFCSDVCSTFFDNANQQVFLSIIKSSGIKIFTDSSIALQLVKLFAVMQSASIVFKTSTSLEIRDGVGVIESFVRKVLHLKKKNTLTNTISLFVCFIPLVYKIWNQSKLVWKARGGKKGLRMYLKLLPVLLSVGMKNAWNSARALTIRDN
ncbi:MAG: hypothetical protein MJ162_00500 [Treponema sp.]|nr:hypothetical protein [Treponema sp.]